jgi:hypothetical protein
MCQVWQKKQTLAPYTKLQVKCRYPKTILPTHHWPPDVLARSICRCRPPPQRPASPPPNPTRGRRERPLRAAPRRGLPPSLAWLPLPLPSPPRRPPESVHRKHSLLRSFVRLKSASNSSLISKFKTSYHIDPPATRMHACYASSCRVYVCHNEPIHQCVHRRLINHVWLLPRMHLINRTLSIVSLPSTPSVFKYKIF